MIYKLIDRIAYLSISFCVMVSLMACNSEKKTERVAVLSQQVESDEGISVGADNIALYHPLLVGKKVAMVVNQTSRIGDSHLVDSLLKLNVNIISIFAPEHGFRGKADAGEVITDGKDSKTGISVISLYGKKKKPLPEDLEEIEVMVFDIQDVGARFYTYISSLHYVMEACAEANIPIIVLDRPNPNAHYIDGPILKPEFKSFVGMHPVPIVYGMTIGEYAEMINGEGWLEGNLKTELTVIKNGNYTHNTYYELPVKPSPNLPNIRSIFLYPSLCFFEGTYVSVGRGTNTQFQVVGHPEYNNVDYSFTPQSTEGAKYPKHENKSCKGIDLTSLTKGSLFDKKGLDLSYLLDSYSNLKQGGSLFFLENNNFFEKLAGTSELRAQIIAGLSEDEIKKSWEPDLQKFKEVRSKYLLYSEY